METKKDKDLQWGEHHSGEKGAVKDANGKLVSDTNELISSVNKPVNLAEEEDGRNREGVREGENKLDKEIQKKPKN